MWQKHFLENVDFKRLITEIFGFPLASFPTNDSDFFDAKRLKQFADYFNVHTTEPLSISLFHFLSEVPICGGAFRDFFHERYCLGREGLEEQYPDQMLIDWAVCNEFCHPREVHYVYLKTLKDAPYSFTNVFGVRTPSAPQKEEFTFFTISDILNNLVISGKKWEKFAQLIARENHRKKPIFITSSSARIGEALLWSKGTLKTHNIILQGLGQNYIIINIGPPLGIPARAIIEQLNKTNLYFPNDAPSSKSAESKKKEEPVEKIEVLKKVLIKDLKDDELERFVNDSTMSGRVRDALVMEKMRRNNSDSEDDKELFNMTHKPRRVISNLNEREETIPVESEKPFSKKANKKEILQHAEGIIVGKIKKSEESPVPGSLEYYKTKSRMSFNPELSSPSFDNSINSDSLINRYEGKKGLTNSISADSIRFAANAAPLPIEEEEEDEEDPSVLSDEDTPINSVVNGYIHLTEKAAKSMDIQRQEYEMRIKTEARLRDATAAIENWTFTNKGSSTVSIVDGNS